MEDIIVARYLFDQLSDGRYVPRVTIKPPGQPAIVISDPEGRIYRDLKTAAAMGSWLLTHWLAKNAPGLDVVIES
jgi:hypothetical protein